MTTPEPNRMLLTGRVVTPDVVIGDGAVGIAGDRIVFVGARHELADDWRGIASPEGWSGELTLLPGLVDSHCHGAAGGEFGADPDSGRRAAAHHLAHGTTTLFASLVSARPEQLVDNVGVCAALVAEATIDGIHLEGPFLSEQRRGAHDPRVLSDASISLLESCLAAADAAGAPGSIRQLTYAPERASGLALPAFLARNGITPAIGHTDCSARVAGDELAAALDAFGGGRRPVVTHVFNGMPPMHHRQPGPVGAALAAAARGEAVLEAIGDGVHLAPETVAMVFSIAAPSCVSLISDAMSACGLADGRYLLGELGVLVEQGVARLEDGGSIAGSTATLLDVVRWCVGCAGISLPDAVRAASLTPAEQYGLGDVGSLQPGKRADVVVVDDGLVPRRVLRRGTWVR